VWSDLLVGLEPPASTIAGIDALVSMNVLPSSPSLAARGPRLHGGTMPSAEEIAPVFAHLFNAVRSAKINMNWVRDLSDAVTPIDARFFSPDGAALSVSGQFYRSRIGGLAARNLARMRRRCACARSATRSTRRICSDPHASPPMALPREIVVDTRPLWRLLLSRAQNPLLLLVGALLYWLIRSVDRPTVCPTKGSPRLPSSPCASSTGCSTCCR